MSEIVPPSAGNNSSSSAQTPAQPASGPRPFTAEDEASLKDSLRRCNSAALEAAIQFRKTGNPELVPVVLMGIIERFVEPDLRSKMHEGDDELRLIEDLGIDSLTMMEIVILAEGVLQVSINNDELRNLRSIGDIKGFIDAKLRGITPPTPVRFTPVERLAEILPVQPPFLFVNEASVSAEGAKGKYRITGQEFFLQGHFKNNPVMPASIMLEALGQLAVVHLLQGLVVEEGKEVDPSTIFFTGCEGVRAHRVCKPGDLLSMTVKLKRSKMPLSTFEGTIRVGQEKTIIAEEITLTFGLRDKVVAAAAPVAVAPLVQAAAPAPTPASGSAQ